MEEPGGLQSRGSQRVRHDKSNLAHTHTFMEIQHFRASQVAQTIKNLPAMQETQVPTLGQEAPMEKGMVTHSSILDGEFHGQRSLLGYSPWGRKELDMTE